MRFPLYETLALPDFRVGRKFSNLEPLRSPDAGLTADLHYDGCFAASRDGHYFLIRDYRPNSVIAKNLRNPFLRATQHKAAGRVYVEEYDDREEWRRRVLELITPPTGGADTAGAGVPRHSPPPAPAFPYAEPLPEGAS